MLGKKMCRNKDGSAGGTNARYSTLNAWIFTLLLNFYPSIEMSTEAYMTLGTILLIIVILILIGALPTWNYSREWGYVPSGGLGLVLLVVLILVLMGRL